MTPVLLALLACDTPTESTTTPAAEWAPEVYCPGDPSGMCGDATGALRAGAAAVEITPPCFEGWADLDGDAELESDETFLDCGCDRVCPTDAGYPGPDEGEGDGVFQAAWLAGFHNSRPANAVHDPIWARALVLDQGSTRLALVSVDLVGWFYQDVAVSRADMPALEVDHLIVTSTHNHEGPDTMGLWGKTESQSGRQAEYDAFVRASITESVRRAVADLREVGGVRVGAVDVRSYGGDDKQGANVLRDARDPKVVDPTLSAALLSDTTGATIATLVHFGNHPEATADENTDITSDYPAALREAMEQGLTYPDEALSRTGYGGVCLFLSGTLGGMMTPLGVTVTDLDGTDRREYDHERTASLGRVKAAMAMDALDLATPLDVATLGLSFANRAFELPVHNWGFQAMLLSGILARDTLHYDPAEPVSDENLPYILTDVSTVRLGPLQWLTVPGEMLPELAVGGYDGSLTGSPQYPIIDADNPNPPDLGLAPGPPYYKDLLSAEHRWIVGLGNDQLGYIVPAYNFELDPVNPWFDEAEGHHYEETNSLGPETAERIQAAAAELMEWAHTHQ